MCKNLGLSESKSYKISITAGNSWSIKIALGNEFKLLKEFKGHTDAVTKAVIHKNELVSFSYDKTIRFWNIETCSVIRTITSKHKIFDGVVDDTRIIECGMSNMINVWSIKTGALLQTLTGHERAPIISKLFVLNGHLYSCGWDYKIGVWKMPDLSHVKFMKHSGVPSAMTNYNSTGVVSADNEGNMYVWQDIAMDEPRVIKQEKAHNGGIFSLAYCFHTREILSAGNDSIVKVWTVSENQQQLACNTIPIEGNRKITNMVLCSKEQEMICQLNFGIIASFSLAVRPGGKEKKWAMNNEQVVHAEAKKDNTINSIEIIDI